MKKILFVCYSLKVGGIERALVEQINYLAERGENVTLFLFTISGQYLGDVDKRVKIIGNMPIFKYLSLTQKEAKQKSAFAYCIRSFFAILVKIVGFPILWKVLKPFIPSIGYYDIAISYTLNVSLKSLYCGCPEFVLEKVKSRKKIAWMHADYKRANIACTYNNTLYKSFDEVVNVTECMKKKFDTFKLISDDKSMFIYNRFNSVQILQKAKSHDVSYVQSIMNIITVGRLEKEKGTDRLMYIAKRMYDKGFKFCWYFVGTGVLDEWCKAFIDANKMDACVKLLGQKDNPYPYIKNANLFVSGSLSETFGLSILEALVLGTPSIAYKFDAINEVLDETNGLVVDSFEKLGDVIEGLINNDLIYNQLKSNTHILIDYNKQNAEQFRIILN